MRHLLLLLSILTVVYSQTNYYTARVVDATTNAPIEGCQIICGSEGAVTNEQGQFNIDCSNEGYVRIQHIGYESITIKLNRILEIVPLEPKVIAGDAIQVVGALSARSLLKSETGTSVIRARDISRTSEPQFEKLIDQLPNLSWAGGSSRPRYFQVRGVGERSQFAGDGPPNFSVGFSLDDLDLSGMAMAGLTFDVERVELFRGPQSSIYGPNALAGFVMMHSRSPSVYNANIISVTGGNASTLNLGTAFNIFNNRTFGARLSIYRGYNNGFRKNQYLESSSSNEHLELMARLKFRWELSNQLHFQGVLLGVDLQNGYDAWTPDNNGFTTYSDKPGEDDQKLLGLVLRSQYSVTEDLSLTSIMSHSTADMLYSYDSDWGNDDFWKADPYNFDPAIEGWHYDFFDKINRSRTTNTQELRMRYAPVNEKLTFILGGYYKNLIEKDNAEGWLFGGDESTLLSEFDLNNLSLYGQVDYQLLDQFTLIANFRTGNRATNYSDDKGTEFSINDRLNGGKIAFRYDHSARKSLFLNLTRGYKAGGINQHPRIIDAHRPFDPEFVNSMEFGYRLASNRGIISLIGFATRRYQQQVSLSSQQDSNDPNSFTYYIGNAGEGSSVGLEFEFDQQFTSRFRSKGSLGLLQSNTDPYEFEISPATFISLGGREFAHAPAFTYSIGLTYDVFTAVTVSARVTGKDDFYFSESHDQQAKGYALVSGFAEYRLNSNISLKLWAENILDTKYAVRGFYFGLEPPNYEDKLYESYGDPRHYGITIQYGF